MKFAFINGQRQEAQPNLSGKCPACDQAMIAKCGEIKLWHWAHKGRRTCDTWWENETEWHRAWKGQFPDAWQEVVHRATNGEMHIADVKTDQEWVIEFQHSYIKPEERRSRDSFYRKLVWIVNGVRRKTDQKQFLNALTRGKPIGWASRIPKTFLDECALLREWAGGPAPVFFDFGDEKVLWWILQGTPDGSAYVAAFSRSEFVEIHRGAATHNARDFDEFVKDIGKLVSQYESPLAAPAPQQAPLPSTQNVQRNPLLRPYMLRRRRL
jgi:hypothetical protein